MKPKKKAHTYSKPVFWDRLIGEPFIIISKDPVAKVDEFLSLGFHIFATDESVALFFGVSVDDIWEMMERDMTGFLDYGLSVFPRVWKVGAMLDESNNINLLTRYCVIRLAPYLAEKSEVAKDLYARFKDEFTEVEEDGYCIYETKTTMGGV